MLAFLLATLFICFTFGATPNDWKSRTIYQLLTDRFSTSTSTTSGCSNLSKYCGGTFKGIINHLDYIQNMGFDAIWISPVITNTEDGYHGYWAQDIYTINSYFGSASDLIDLGNALHERDMYLMIDVVANHMGNCPSYHDVSSFVPFNNWNQYYHDCNDCPVNCNIQDWNDQDQVEQCELSGLPDLNQSEAFVNTTLNSWVEDYVVKTWQADGLRIDTVPEVSKEFWKIFQKVANVYGLGEVFNGDPTYVGPYQQVLDGVFNYPMFYTIRDVFGSGESCTNIDSRLSQNNNYKDVSLLGVFVDNHDNDRFLCDYSNDPNYRKYMNAITYTLTTVGIPVIYYGTEQAYHGCSDPNNREVLWTSDYNEQSSLYVFIQTVITARKKLQIWNENYTVLKSESNFYSFTRGSEFLVALTNVGYDTAQVSYTIANPGLQETKYCNIFWPTQDCFTYSGGSLTIYLDNGEAKIYVPSSKIWDGLTDGKVYQVK